MFVIFSRRIRFSLSISVYLSKKIHQFRRFKFRMALIARTIWKHNLNDRIMGDERNKVQDVY